VATCSEMASTWTIDEPMTTASSSFLPAAEAGPSVQPFQPFVTHEPKTREERRAGADKAAKEKTRIAERNKRVEPPPADVVTPLPNTSQYMEGHQRFIDRDAAAAEHARKQHVLMQKEEMYERKRKEAYDRDMHRWEQNEKACHKGEYVAASKRALGQGGTRRNQSGMPYNILTLHYVDSAEGRQLQHQDEVTRYKAHLRSNNLYSKGLSTGFNILNGEPAWSPPLIAPPAGYQASQS